MSTVEHFPEGYDSEKTIEIAPRAQVTSIVIPQEDAPLLYLC